MLPVAAPRPMTGYSRAKFPHWAIQHGTCDTRETVLARAGQDVKQDAKCRAVSGHWHSPYDNLTLTSASQVDIDHLVPLANAWRSGADQWTTATRKAFANDLNQPQLLAVSAASNRAKGDQSPDQWMPKNHDYCHHRPPRLPPMNELPQLASQVTAGPGGVMTDEVGVITGDLTVTTTTRPDGRADITVEYTGAEERYVMTGSPSPMPAGGLSDLHATVLDRVRVGQAATAPG
ncbi:HNH endonuclease family protein [Streptomyces orinoci]|uniref:HNH endonuclease family protein n=1 Tax=Streptomyces orinoci TaxID=67339 RepID=UPI003BAA3830